MKSQLKSVERDANKIDTLRTKLGVKVEQVIQEQQAVITASEQGIDRLNSDLSAIRRRLEVYTGKSPRVLDERYYTLKTDYEKKLKERTMLENAHSMAEESITAAKLHIVPGE